MTSGAVNDQNKLIQAVINVLSVNVIKDHQTFG